MAKCVRICSHPIEMGKMEIEQFLTWLAVDQKVSPTTQNQAFSAIRFLYKEILGIDMSEWNIQALRAQERKHIPVVLTEEEVKQVLGNLTGNYQLIVYMMYGCGLRMSEALNIRVKDIDFGFDRVYIWDSKSLKDRTIPLPQKIKEQLKVQVTKVEEIHKKDVADGYGTVYMPYALERKKINRPKINEEYINWVVELKKLISSSQIKASLSVNREMLAMY